MLSDTASSAENGPANAGLRTFDSSMVNQDTYQNAVTSLPSYRNPIFN